MNNTEQDFAKLEIRVLAAMLRNTDRFLSLGEFLSREVELRGLEVNATMGRERDMLTGNVYWHGLLVSTYEIDNKGMLKSIIKHLLTIDEECTISSLTNGDIEAAAFRHLTRINRVLDRFKPEYAEAIVDAREEVLAYRWDPTKNNIAVVHNPDHKPTEKEAQRMVRGWVELEWIHEDEQLLMNDEGNYGNMPVNFEASLLAGHKIYGNVVHLVKPYLW